MKVTPDTIYKIAHYLEKHSDEKINLRTLGEKFNLNSETLRKEFKNHMGVTPKSYLDEIRERNWKGQLRSEKSILHSQIEVGKNKPTSKKLGMHPKDYKKYGAGTHIFYAEAKTIMGYVLIGATEKGICYVQVSKEKNILLNELKKEFPRAQVEKMAKERLTQFKEWMVILNSYLSGEVKKLNLPLDISGTVFQIKVWKLLQTIPRGETWSYQELAQKIGNPKASRAVASACARNKIALIIPCHRVIRGSGDLAGFRWGLENKKKLLDLEKNELH